MYDSNIMKGNSKVEWHEGMLDQITYTSALQICFMFLNTPYICFVLDTQHFLLPSAFSTKFQLLEDDIMQMKGRSNKD